MSIVSVPFHAECQHVVFFPDLKDSMKKIIFHNLTTWKDDFLDSSVLVHCCVVKELVTEHKTLSLKLQDEL